TDVGHGYCATDSWIRHASDATWMQGPVGPASYAGLNNETLGTLHPNEEGWAQIANRVYPYVGDLLPAPTVQPAQPINVHDSNTNTSGNTQVNPSGTPTVSSRVSASGWLIGCTPTGQLCANDSDHAVTEMVVEAAPTTFLTLANATVNGTK